MTDLSANIDLSSSLLNVLGKVDVQLGRAAKATEQQNRLLADAYRAEQPRYIVLAGQCILNANGFGIITWSPQAKVDQGWFWNVHRITVGGLTPTTVTAGRADLFIEAQSIGQITSLSQTALQNWVDYAGTLPNIATYGDAECRVNAGERLQLVISNGTSGQQIVASAALLAVQEAANKQMWSV